MSEAENVTAGLAESNESLQGLWLTSSADCLPVYWKWHQPLQSLQDYGCSFTSKLKVASLINRTENAVIFCPIPPHNCNFMHYIIDGNHGTN